MCEFCENIAKDDKEYFSKRLQGGDFIFHDKQGFGILIDTGDSGCLGCLNEIKFCPMCGRKLTEEQSMYQAVYKCRLCGELGCGKKLKATKIEDFTITNTLGQMEQTTFTRKRGRVDLHVLHHCKDGSLGLADFQGFKKVDE